jgi:hypothetical protein
MGIAGLMKNETDTKPGPKIKRREFLSSATLPAVSRVDPTVSDSRRRFLRGSAAAAAALAMLEGSRLIVGPGEAWALEMRSFTPEQGETLLRLLRDVFPHDYLADVFYANALAPLDDAAAASEETRRMLTAGIADLDGRAVAATGRPFSELSSEATRVEIVEAVQGAEFFAAVHGTCQIPFYNQADLWPAFGFEGPSSPFGGYLNRGFDDLDWI